MTNKEAITNIKVMLERTNNLVFYKEEIEAIEKQDKVISLLKEKQVDVGLIQKCKSVNEYNFIIIPALNNKMLAQDEFNLLKEAFCNDRI